MVLESGGWGSGAAPATHRWSAGVGGEIYVVRHRPVPDPVHGESVLHVVPPERVPGHDGAKEGVIGQLLTRV